ncbi:hypothetical protein LSH36_548g05013 [Paralvinella palmiformis]|uniref:EGF-like domain-containing protein n=1 Tax=Paralvinella palmiformis TaxID=53620 RepID=A0AAD9J7C6_9ANNE|nr:hypothetical protein LSH36_548g05013 [Paralvinella palmiformis]
MKKGVIFYFSYLSTLLMASPTFTVYRDLVVKLDAFGITGFSIVTSITECKRRCLDNEMGCLAANMIPIRRGIYSWDDPELRNMILFDVLLQDVNQRSRRDRIDLSERLIHVGYRIDDKRFYVWNWNNASAQPVYYCPHLNNCQVTGCLNGGSCARTAVGVTCQCPDNYIGVSCEIPVNYCQMADCPPDTCEATSNGYSCIWLSYVDNADRICTSQTCLIGFMCGYDPTKYSCMKV